MRPRRGSVLLSSVVALAAALTVASGATPRESNAIPAAAAADDPNMGLPPSNAAVTPGNYFSYPNRTSGFQTGHPQPGA